MITDPNVKSHVYKYQKYLKIRILHEREAKLKIKEDLQKENKKNEAREHATISATALAAQPMNKGKGILDGPSSPHVSSLENTLQKGAEFKRNLEKINFQLQTHTEMAETHSKKQETQVSSEQT